MLDAGKKGDTNGSIEDLVAGDEEGESSVASVEDQLRKEMAVYEVWCVRDCQSRFQECVFICNIRALISSKFSEKN